MEKLNCWKCNISMEKIIDTFQGFRVKASQCRKCKEIIYDEQEIEPILKYNKLRTGKKGLISKVGILGNSKILRIPKTVEQIYNITKGRKIEFELEPEAIKLKVSEHARN